jgi:hypothetical protein
MGLVRSFGRIVIPGRERRLAVANPESGRDKHFGIPGSIAAVAALAPE